MAFQPFSETFNYVPSTTAMQGATAVYPLPPSNPQGKITTTTFPSMQTQVYPTTYPLSQPASYPTQSNIAFPSVSSPVYPVTYPTGYPTYQPSVTTPFDGFTGQSVQQGPTYGMPQYGVPYYDDAMYALPKVQGMGSYPYGGNPYGGNLRSSQFSQEELASYYQSYMASQQNSTTMQPSATSGIKPVVKSVPLAPKSTQPGKKNKAFCGC